MNAGQHRTPVWVVTWHDAGTDESSGTRAHWLESDARQSAAELQERGFVVSVEQGLDLTEDEVWDSFVATFGPEIRPGIFLAQGRLVQVEVHAARDVVVRNAYMSEDPADDRDLNRIPAAPHPRRLGLAWLIDDTEDALWHIKEGQQRIVVNPRPGPRPP